jgi:hypothetical protein
MKMCEDLARNFGDVFHHDKAPSLTFFFTQEYFIKNNMTVVSHPPNFSVSLIDDKTERSPF